MKVGETYGYAVTTGLNTENSNLIFDETCTTVKINCKDFELVNDSENDGGYLVINLGTLKEDGTFTGGDFTTGTKTGVPTSKSNNIALFGIMGILAPCGAGFAYGEERTNSQPMILLEE